MSALLPNTLVMSEPLPNRVHDAEFEPARLLEIFDNDRLAVTEILREAAASTREVIDRLSEQVASGDKQAVASLLHALTGVAANIGANGLSALSGDFLKHMRQTQSLPVDLVERLRSAHERFAASLQEFLRGTS